MGCFARDGKRRIGGVLRYGPGKDPTQAVKMMGEFTREPLAQLAE